MVMEGFVSETFFGSVDPPGMAVVRSSYMDVLVRGPEKSLWREPLPCRYASSAL